MHETIAMRIKLFDNAILSIFFLSLPFTYALTFDLGFPLKISEVTLFLIVLILVFKVRIRYSASHIIFFVFSLFVLECFISVIVNFLWEYPYTLKTFESRFGYKFDSLMKFGYLILAFLTFFISSNAFNSNEKKYIQLFLAGAFVSSLYSWYLFFSALLGIPELLLWGMEEPQVIGVSSGIFIRSGTFKEGNYMGMFLLLSVVLSFYSNKKVLGYFFAATVLTTFSSIGFACTLLFLISYYFKQYYKPKYFYKLIIAVALLGLCFFALLSNDNFRLAVLSKFSFNSSTSVSNSGELSKVDRLNTAIIGYKIGLQNPVLGVGLSNFALHHDWYNEDLRFANSKEKRIPNNVYVEVFSETGIIGLLLFLWLLYLLYVKTRQDHSGVLRSGLISLSIYFIAFPTFTILYIWVFFGLIASKNNG